MNGVHYKSGSVTWETPQELFDAVRREFPISTDVCADRATAKCERYFSPEQDGLAQKWSGFCWMNPPYKRGEIDRWIRKAYESAVSGDATVVCLVPARTGSPWFHDYAKSAEIRFIRNKLTFRGARSVAPFNSALMIFHAHLDPAGIVTWILKPAKVANNAGAKVNPLELAAEL